MSLSLGILADSPLVFLLVGLLLASTLLSCVWAYKRLRQQKGRASLVVGLNITFALCVLALGLDIRVTDNTNKTLFLLTSGTTTSALAPLPLDAMIYTLEGLNPEVAQQLSRHSIQPLDSLSQLFPVEGNVGTLHILGAGLSNQQWQDLTELSGDQLNTLNIQFSPPEAALGLVDMHWQKEAVVGEIINITGRLAGPQVNPDKIYTLDLINPVGEIANTIRLKTGESFELQVAAKSVGKWLYRLQLKTSSQTGTIADEPLAFHISNPPQLKLLIKQAAPSFETRQLKNWASEFGAKISVLTQISRNQDIRQNVNFSPQELARLTEPFSQNALSLFDLLLIDGRSLLALSAQQMQSVKEAIGLGLGLYVFIDQPLVDAWPVTELNWLGVNSIQALNTDSHFAIPVWPHSQIEEAIPLTKAKLQTTAQTLVSSQTRDLLVTKKNFGLGKVALSLINSSYGWKTAGLTEQYSHYWQSIFLQLSRPAAPPYWIPPAENTIPWLGQRYHVCMITNADNAQFEQMSASQNKALIGWQDKLQPEKYCVTSWLEVEGWQQFSWSNSQANDSAINSVVYLYSEADWQVWRHSQQIKATRQFIQNRPTVSSKDKLQIDKPLDKLYFWWALVLLGSFLWLERKLFSN